MPDAPTSSFLLYRVADVKPDAEHGCGVEEAQNLKKSLAPQVRQQAQQQRSVGGQCLKVRLAIASDFEMFTTYGTVAATEAFIVGVINDMAGDYIGVFQEDVEFTIVEQFVSTSASTSLETALTSTTNALTLLANFSTWGQGANGFTQGYDLSQIWVERDIAGSSGSGAVGVASTPGICTQNSRVAIFENFSTVAWQLRVLASHETGHNFSITHDPAGSPFIMAPAVNNTTSWSAQSLAEFDDHVKSAACVEGTFALVGSPTAVFDVPSQLCLNQSVQLFNRSGRAPTSTSWSLPGNTPSSSTANEPTVSYATVGNKTITLTNSNSACGSVVNVTNTKTVTVINEQPPAVTCTPNPANSATTGNFLVGIERVAFGSVDNTTQTAGRGGTSYTDNTCALYEDILFGSLPIEIDIFTFQNQVVKVFVDLDNDGTWDAGEELFSQVEPSTGSPDLKTITTNLTIPATATLDELLRMRVMVVATGSAAGVAGCTNASFQEVEDYAIRLPSALPVEFVTLSATATDRSNLVEWTVASEVNVDRYRVEHRTAATAWSVVGEVLSNGKSAYEFVHTNSGSGTHYYRIANLDYDGTSATSDAVVLERIAKDRSLTVTPSGTSESIIELADWSPTTAVHLNVVDAQGRLLVRQQLRTDANGRSYARVSLEGLARGFYVVHARSALGEVKEIVLR